MQIKKHFLGQRDFWSEEEIRALVGGSAEFDPSAESLDDAEALLIFETSKQHTWLIVSSERLYCVLDDNRKPEPALQWTLDRDELMEGDRLVAPIRTRDKSARAGLLDIGPRKSWLFSKTLYSSGSLEEALTDAVKKKMATRG